MDDDRQALRESCVRSPAALVLFRLTRLSIRDSRHLLARKYHFGNIPLVNYLPRRWRDRLAPHVKVYTRRDLSRLFDGLPVKVVERRIIFGAYDNLIARFGFLGRWLRAALQTLERTPLQIFGLSHFWVVEKIPPVQGE